MFSVSVTYWKSHQRAGKYPKDPSLACKQLTVQSKILSPFKGISKIIAFNVVILFLEGGGFKLGFLCVALPVLELTL